VDFAKLAAWHARRHGGWQSSKQPPCNLPEASALKPWPNLHCALLSSFAPLLEVPDCAGRGVRRRRVLLDDKPLDLPHPARPRRHYHCGAWLSAGSPAHLLCNSPMRVGISRTRYTWLCRSPTLSATCSAVRHAPVRPTTRRPHQWSAFCASRGDPCLLKYLAWAGCTCMHAASLMPSLLSCPSPSVAPRPPPPSSSPDRHVACLPDTHTHTHTHTPYERERWRYAAIPTKSLTARCKISKVRRRDGGMPPSPRKEPDGRTEDR